MKKLGAILIALALSGCALFQSAINPITQSRVDTINASWGATLALGANYHDACAQRLIPPSCRPIVLQLQPAAIPVQAAVNTMNKAAIGGTTTLATLAQTASDAINDYKTLQMQYGIK